MNGFESLEGNANRMSPEAEPVSACTKSSPIGWVLIGSNGN